MKRLAVFTSEKCVSLRKNHMGAAIMKFINRLNIQTSWLRKTKTGVQFLSRQQDTSQLGPGRFPGRGCWICNNYTQAAWEIQRCLECPLGFLCDDDSLGSRSYQIPSPSFLTEVTTAADAQTALGILVLSPQVPQGRGNWRTESDKQRTQQDSQS